jgi:photosystem II stability/assembly factor-like uncharacterized protein/PKD repeat protein
LNRFFLSLIFEKFTKMIRTVYKLSLFISFSLYLNMIFAQWVQYPSLPVQNIEAVQAWDQNVIYASQPEKMLRSTDGGLNWSNLPVADAVGNVFLTTTFYDFHLLSPGVIVAVGLSSMGNQESIYKSTDSGVSWTVVNIYGNGTWPRISNAIHFPNSTTGFVAGTNGRILKTTNGGNNWTALSSGTTSEIKDIWFTNSSSGYAVGNGRVLRTTNGGSSWTSTVFSGSIFNSVHFPTANVGYAVGEDRKMIKTTNAGLNWTLSTMNIPTNTILNSVFFVSDLEGYVTGANGVIYRTTNGGQYWEKQQLLDGLNDVFFLAANNGFLAGDQGQLLHTINSNDYLPVANFSSSSNIVCHDSTLILTNSSDPSFSFQWLINGAPFSSDYSTSLNFTNPDQLDTISLVAFNGFFYDTLNRIISIQQDLQFSINGGIQANMVCINQTKNAYVYNSLPGVSYSLTKNGTQVGTIQNGNGSTLTFSTGNITSISTICLKGVKIIAGCGSNTETWCTTVEVQNPNPATVMGFSQDTICENLTGQLSLFASQQNVSYQLYQGTSLIGASQLGNGNTLVFLTNSNSTNTVYYVKGTSQLGCVTNFPNMTLYIQSPGVYWTSTTMNPEVGEPIDVINSSSYPQGIFTWDFGAGASTSISNLIAPQNIVFNNIGNQTVSLTYVTPLGCSQTVTKVLRVIQAFTQGNCEKIEMNSFGNSISRLYAINRDKNENIFAIYKHSSSSLNYTQSNHSDSLNLGISPIMNFDKGYSLIKYNSKGIPKWSTTIRSGIDGIAGDVVTDSSGNVYMAYYHNNYGDSYRIYSSDGRFITVANQNSSSTSHPVIIVKYDPNGIYLWHSTFMDVYTVWKISLKLDEHQNLFASGQYRCVKYNPQGVLQWGFTGDIADIEPDHDGGVYKLRRTDLQIDHYSLSGALLSTSLPINTLNSNTVIGARHLAQDENGALYVLGNFRGSFQYGLDTLTDIFNSGNSHEDVYLAKLSRNLEHLWIKQFKGPSEMPIQGIDIMNNTIMAGILNTGSDLEYIQGDTIFQNASNAYFLFKCDTLGNHDEITKFYDTPQAFIGSNIPLDNIVISNGGDNFDFGFTYKDNFTASTSTNFSLFASSGNDYSGINLASLSCVFNDFPNNQTPIAYFSGPVNVCLGQAVHFSDQSINNPIGWSWTFDEGSITTSNTQNPTVTFNTLGIHPITLSVMNIFGQSELYTAYVFVSDSPIADVFGDDYVCSGSSVAACVSSSYSYFWPNGSNLSCYGIGPLFADSTIFLTSINGGCFLQIPFTFHVESAPSITLNGTIPDSVCSVSPPFTLPIAIPAGGIYFSDFGAVTDNVFNPADATFGINYIYYVYNSPNAGCTSQYLDSVFVFNGNLWATIQGEVQGCQGTELNFNANASSSTMNYLWNLDGGISSDVTSQNVVVNFNIPGNHIISLIVSNGQCQSTEINHNIYIEATPNIQLDDFNPDIICIDNGLISVPSATPTGGFYYDNFGALVDGITLDPTLMTIDQPNYVYYLYTSQLGCNALDSSVITVTDCSGFNNGINNSNYVFQDASDGEFYLHLISEVQDVVLYNSMGQIIRDFPINSNNIRLDLSKEPVGIYFLSTKELNQNKIYKLFNK